MAENYVIILVGVSEQQLKTLPEGMIGITRTENIDEMAELYSASNYFVNLTYSDTYPTVNMEAIACGVPVITYKTGGSPESVTTSTGRVVEQGNIDAVIDAIHEVDGMDREQLRADCRKYAEEHFDKQKCFQQYINLYKEILNM